MRQPIVSTRLITPQPRKNYIIRQPLFTKLEQIKDCRITVITGSPGSGKTTLLSSYIKETSLPVKWVSLHNECNHVVLFWSYVIEVLRDVITTSQKEFIDYFQTSAKANINEALAGLINTISNTNDIYLVLDDFHTLKNKTLITSIAYFINHMPTHMHVIILSREEPNLYLASFELQGKLLVIDENDLRLSNDEATRFLKTTLTLTYPEDILVQLIQQADGWIGGLQLLAIAATKSNKNKGNLLLNNTMVQQYLTKELYEHLRKDEQQFLTYTSILAYFNQTICTYLFPSINYTNMIIGLLNKNLMLQCIDDNNGIYTYHNILENYLQTLFLQLDTNLQVQTHRKAADIFYQLEDYEECLHHLFILEDYQQAMCTILALPQNATHLAYMSRVPIKEAVKNFDFAFQKFFYHYSSYEFDLCLSIYELAIKYIDSDARYEAFLGAKLLLNQEAFTFNEKIITIEKIRELPMHPITKALILTKNAAFLFYQDQYKEALQSVNESMEYSKCSGNMYIQYYNLTLKIQICEEMGLFNKALSVQEQARQLVNKNQIMKYFHGPTFSITITGIYLKQMDLRCAKMALSNYEEEINIRGGQLKQSFDYNMIEYLFLCGDVTKATQLLNNLMTKEAYGDILMVSSLLKYLFQAGAMAPAMQDDFIDAYENTKEYSRTLNSKLLYAQILNGKGEREKALFVIDDVLRYSRKIGTHLKIVEATLLKLSILINTSSDIRKMTDVYKEAIYYACQNNICMPFYFQSDTIAEVHQKYDMQIYRNLSKQEKKFHEEMIKFCITKENCILSERELEVIQSLATGLTNKEIAQNLHISLATVKTHILNIYRKLNVKTRVAALDAARKMGLL